MMKWNVSLLELIWRERRIFHTEFGHSLECFTEACGNRQHLYSAQSIHTVCPSVRVWMVETSFELSNKPSWPNDSLADGKTADREISNAPWEI